MCYRTVFLIAVVAGVVCMSSDGRAAELLAKPAPEGVRVTIDGQLFTEYLTRSGAKPILWPILGPTGQADDPRLPDGRGAQREEGPPSPAVPVVHARGRQRHQLLGRERQGAARSGTGGS